MPLFHIFKDHIFAAGADMAEILVTLTHNGFPNQKLRGVHMSKFVSGGAILGYPGGIDIAGVSRLDRPA